MPTEVSRPIPASEAEALMKTQKDIVKQKGTIVSDAIKASFPGDSKILNYYEFTNVAGEKNSNCFEFTKETVDRFFHNGTSDTGMATHLIALMGADDQGHPTLILVGCTKTGNTYNSLKSLDGSSLQKMPGTQHPPFLADVSFPVKENVNLANEILTNSISFMKISEI